MRFCTTATSWILLALLPFTASALGLGNVSLDSALNEPFSAEIPLQSVGNTDLSLLTVSLASRDTFERYDLDKPLFLSTFEFVLDKNADGQPIIRISSTAPVAEPFVTFLVDVKWPSGRLLREYTVLLDPPLFEEAVVQAQSTVSPAVTATPVATDAAGQVDRQPEPIAEPIAEPQPTPVLLAPSATTTATPAPTESVAEAPAPVEQVSELRAVVEPEPLPEIMAEEATAEPAQELAPEQELQTTFEPETEQAAEPETEQVSQAETLTDAYTAQRGDTLWSIANRSRSDSGLTNNQMMLALFRANPEAFLGNINALKAGSILRIPEQQDALGLGVIEANEEAVQQHAAWSSGSITRTESAGDQLQLVAPSDDYSADAEQAFAADADGELQSGDGALETRIEEDERLLQIEDEELSALQDRIGDGEAESDIAADADSLALTDEALESEAGALDEAILVEEIDGAVDSPFADELAGEAEATPLDDEADASVDPSKVVQLPAQDESSLVGTLLGSYWLWGAAGLILLAVLFLARRRSGGVDEEAEATGTWEEDDLGVMQDQTLKDFSDLPSFDESIVVDEVDEALTEDAAPPAEVPEPEAEPEAEPIFDEAAEASMRDAAEEEAKADLPVDFSEDLPDDITEQSSVDLPEIAEPTTSLEQLDEADIKADAAPARDDEEELPLEKTISTGAPLNLDQADPIAEAEFHMAYGLYDQAADLLVRALDDEPDNRTYRVKLIEVYFVWENKEGFLLQATAFHESIGDGSDPDWNKVLILGKQLCPDAELFAGADATAPTADAMDLELSDVGETEIDFSLGGTEVQALDEDALDMDLGDDLLGDVTDHDLALDLGAEADSGEDADAGLALNFDDEPATEDDADDDSYDATLRLNDDLAVTMESPTLDTLGSEAPTVETDMGSATMESPTLNIEGQDDLDSAATMESPTLEVSGSVSETSEMPALNEDSLSDPTALDIDLSGLADFQAEEDAPPVSVDIDSTLNQLDNTNEFLTQGDMSKTIADDEATLMAKFDIDAALVAGSDTLAQPLLAATDGDTAEQPEISIDDELGMGMDSADSSAPEDATMTEVGTKLDLARAYIDMGDPDGARSILNEVLEEGGDSQQQEAHQLLEELGG